MKVNDYVRYEYENIVYIGKIKFISEVMSGLDETLQLDIDNCMEEILKRDVIKSSPNIIDLIEVGDYVNGMLVTNMWVDKETGNIEFEFNNNESYLYPKSWNYESRVTKYKIKLIVTKEQFSQMEYKIDDKKVVGVTR